MIFDPLFEEFKENKMNLIKKQLDISVGDNGGEFIPTFEPQTEIEFIKELNQQQGVKETNGKLDYSEINFTLLDLMAKRFMDNKHKYPKGNSLKEIDIKELEWAAFRHIRKMIQPIKDDTEDYIDHLTAVANNLSMILDQIKLQSENK